MRNFDSAYLKIAEIWAQNSFARRAKVGAIIVKDNRIISDGFKKYLFSKSILVSPMNSSPKTLLPLTPYKATDKKKVSGQITII